MEFSEQAMRRNVSDSKRWNRDRQKYLKNDRALHDTLIRASGNRFWENTYYGSSYRIEIFGN